MFSINNETDTKCQNGNAGAVVEIENYSRQSFEYLKLIYKTIFRILPSE